MDDTLRFARRRLTAALVSAVISTFAIAATLPGAAQAHGIVAPVATSYLARVANVPPGVEAKVVDGDQRMWLQVPAGLTLVVLDYDRAPYLRFSTSGVQVNSNSVMYYLNQTPTPWQPPANLTASTPPSWHSVSGSHTYGWHDGRLADLSTESLAPGQRYVGKWIIPVRVNGALKVISGGLWHAGSPSIVWFWPLVVVLLCVLAAWRLRREELDRRVARALAVLALIALAVAAVGRQLHGRPTVSAVQVVELVLILAFVGWGLWRVLLQRPGYFSYFVISFVVLWEGVGLIPTLLHGYVLLAEPAFLVRAATVTCLAGGAGMLLLVFRLAELPAAKPVVAAAAIVAIALLTGCGGAGATPS